jgi:glutamyl-tRNA synthetase
MRISHVIRGDDHVNNTPRQINILRALVGDAGVLPEYGHVPMILGPDGDKLSKRHGAVSVTQYEDEGYLPEAMINYLSRLGWSHGDDELFGRDQLVRWFDGTHLSKSAAQWDVAKLNWVNAQHLKQLSLEALVPLVRAQLQRRGIDGPDDARVAQQCALYRERCATTVELADWVAMHVSPAQPSPEDLHAHVGEALRPALASLGDRLATAAWTRADIGAAVKATLAEHGLKMPVLATAVRVLVCGRAQTPSLDAVLELFTREQVLARLRSVP